ncbi:unnamed protein product [Linum trigynum]|uniref:Ubiquitin-like domain-containing protein n=2 Tax=Linum trigynum TaxID=586398 RepID=A0AAV2DGM8_9ROSI
MEENSHQFSLKQTIVMNGGSSSGGRRSNSGSGSDSDDEAAAGFLYLGLGDYSLSYYNASLNMSAAELKEWVNEHYGVPISRIKIYQESNAAEDGELMDDRRTLAYYGFTKGGNRVYRMRIAEQRRSTLFPLWVSESGVDGYSLHFNVTEATTVAQLKDMILERLRGPDGGGGRGRGRGGALTLHHLIDTEGLNNIPMVGEDKPLLYYLVTEGRHVRMSFGG